MAVVSFVVSTAVVAVPVPRRLLRLPYRLLLLIFESLLPSEKAPVFKHVPAIRVQRPKRPFARFVRSARHFDEAIVEG